MREAKTIRDVSWSGEYGFLCEESWRDVHLPEGLSIQRNGMEKILADSKALPQLHGAPVASWLLARVAFLGGRRFPFSYGQVIGSDGADYVVRFYCIASPATPAGVLYCCGSSREISFSLNYPKDQQGEKILDAFQAKLLEKPADVARCRLVVQYTEMTDPDVAFHIPVVYGWDGKRYINEKAPEHTVDPDEYDV